MSKFLRWTMIAALLTLAASLLGRATSVEGTLVHQLSDIGLFAAIITGVMLCMCLQQLLDQGHDSLESLIAQADSKLAQLPAEEGAQARSLLEEARACLAAAEVAPDHHLHAGPEIRCLRTGMLKVRESLALL